MYVITHLGHQPKSHKYFSGPLSFYTYRTFLVKDSIIAPLLSMAESLSDNPEVNRALQAVALNILDPAFKGQAISTKPRWVWHQTVYDFTNSDFFWVNVNALWIPRTRRTKTIPTTICPRIFILLGVSTPVNQVPSIPLTPLLTLASNMKPRVTMIAI